MTSRKAARAASYVKAQRGRPCCGRVAPRGGTGSGVSSQWKSTAGSQPLPH